MPTLVANEPTKYEGSLSQARMKDFYNLQREYIDIRARYFAAQAKIVLMLAAGVHQQPGKYRLERKVRSARRVSWKEEYIKVRGVKAAAAVLDNTKPKRYYSLKFENVINP